MKFTKMLTIFALLFSLNVLFNISSVDSRGYSSSGRSSSSSRGSSSGSRSSWGSSSTPRSSGSSWFNKPTPSTTPKSSWQSTSPVTPSTSRSAIVNNQVRGRTQQTLRQNNTSTGNMTQKYGTSSRSYGSTPQTSSKTIIVKKYYSGGSYRPSYYYGGHYYDPWSFSATYWLLHMAEWEAMRQHGLANDAKYAQMQAQINQLKAQNYQPPANYQENLPSPIDNQIQQEPVQTPIPVHLVSHHGFLYYFGVLIVSVGFIWIMVIIIRRRFRS